MTLSICNGNFLLFHEAEAVLPLDKHPYRHRSGVFLCRFVPSSHAVVLHHYALSAVEKLGGRHRNRGTGITIAEISAFDVPGSLDEDMRNYIVCGAGADVAEHESFFVGVGVHVPIDEIRVRLPLKQRAVQFVDFMRVIKGDTGDYDGSHRHDHIRPVGDRAQLHCSSFPCCVGLLFVALSLALRGKGLTVPLAFREVA